jgi:HAD superfamily hydrolase (TIGR01509 family)
VTPPLRAVLWDLDGTLVDSGDYHWRSWRDTMREESLELTYEQFLDSFGQRNDRILANWLGEGTDPSRITRIGDAKEARYRALARREGLVVLPGAREWVTRLHAQGWRQAIASSAPRENVDVMIEGVGIRHVIDAFVSAEDVTKGKPDPDVFLAAASRLHVAPARSIVVEDAAAGVEAARRAGMKCIGVNAGVTLAADVFVRSLTDLPADVFERLLGRGSSA